MGLIIYVVVAYARFRVFQTCGSQSPWKAFIPLLFDHEYGVLADRVSYAIMGIVASVIAGVGIGGSMVGGMILMKQQTTPMAGLLAIGGLLLTIVLGGLILVCRWKVFRSFIDRFGIDPVMIWAFLLVPGIAELILGFGSFSKGEQ